MPHIYEKNGAAIYAESFATIRAAAELSRFTAAEEIVVVRMIHASGLVELATYVQFTPDFAEAARTALEAGAPVLCCLLYTSPSPRDRQKSRMPSSA